MTQTVYIGLGGNIGRRAATINRALELLNQTQGLVVRQVSGTIETDPVGPAQPRYLNAAAELGSDLSAEELLDRCQQVERELGRRREVEIRWGPRTCDLDILMIDQLQFETERLTVPHPRMHERRFVLAPLAQIAGEAVHPALGKTVSELLAELEDPE